MNLGRKGCISQLKRSANAVSYCFTTVHKLAILQNGERILGVFYSASRDVVFKRGDKAGDDKAAEGFFSDLSVHGPAGREGETVAWPPIVKYISRPRNLQTTPKVRISLCFFVLFFFRSALSPRYRKRKTVDHASQKFLVRRRKGVGRTLQCLGR